ncbi:MAG TPA: hypothetical protein PLY93_06870, partial [Turneriella sp.]|nr:hypothetical protein [Turneriella sp.]
MEANKISSGANLLSEAEEMLVAPAKNVKIRLLIIFNFIVSLPVLVFNTLTLVKFGNFANPARDWYLYPTLHLIMLSSGVYNLSQQIKGTSGNPIVVRLSTWATVLILQLVSIVTVQANSNLPLSFLWDVSISLVLIYLTAVMLNRWAALVYAAVAFSNMLFLASRLGFDFEYVLQAPPGFPFQLPAKGVLQFVILWGLLMSISVLVAFSEGGVIGKILKAIPQVVNKIRDAGDTQRHLEMANMRMG